MPYVLVMAMVVGRLNAEVVSEKKLMIRPFPK